MPPPGMPAGSFLGSGLSAMSVSVVRISAPIDAAFCSAERVTLNGSMMPASNMSTSSPVIASKPIGALFERTLLTSTEPSKPAFSAIWRSGSSSALRTMLMPIFSSAHVAP